VVYAIKYDKLEVGQSMDEYGDSLTVTNKELSEKLSEINKSSLEEAADSN